MKFASLTSRVRHKEPRRRKVFSTSPNGVNDFWVFWSVRKNLSVNSSAKVLKFASKIEVRSNKKELVSLNALPLWMKVCSFQTDWRVLLSHKMSSPFYHKTKRWHTSLLQSLFKGACNEFGLANLSLERACPWERRMFYRCALLRIAVRGCFLILWGRFPVNGQLEQDELEVECVHLRFLALEIAAHFLRCLALLDCGPCRLGEKGKRCLYIAAGLKRWTDGGMVKARKSCQNARC